jgi:tRNA pseudouridine-54 N-methylase
MVTIVFTAGLGGIIDVRRSFAITVVLYLVALPLTGTACHVEVFFTLVSHIVFLGFRVRYPLVRHFLLVSTSNNNVGICIKYSAFT